MVIALVSDSVKLRGNTYDQNLHGQGVGNLLQLGQLPRDQLGREAYEEMRGYFGHQRFFSGDDGALSPLFFPRWLERSIETMMMILMI